MYIFYRFVTAKKTPESRGYTLLSERLKTDLFMPSLHLWFSAVIHKCNFMLCNTQRIQATKSVYSYRTTGGFTDVASNGLTTAPVITVATPRPTRPRTTTRPRPTTPRRTTPSPTTPRPTTASPSTGCRAVGGWQQVAGMDEWCVRNCNHVPSFCPTSHCSCD